MRFPNSVCAGDIYNGTCYSAEECSSRGGSSSGTCANGYGVCCICKSQIYSLLPLLKKIPNIQRYINPKLLFSIHIQCTTYNSPSVSDPRISQGTKRF